MSFATVAIGRSVARKPLTGGQAFRLLVFRNFLVYRRAWHVFVTGFLEPVFYLFSIGVGVGQLVTGFQFNGHQIPYADFVAPGMLAASAMNGSMLDATFNFFWKLKYAKLYDQQLATPLSPMDIARGELGWSQLRGGIYSAGFLVVMLCMGYVHSWWALLVLPGTLLFGFSFGAVCMALTTWMRSWQDFEFVTLGTMPMFLFSATFYPITAYPDWLRWVIECTPLYRGVVLCRELCTGTPAWESVVSVVYLAAFGVIGLLIVRRRLAALLLT